MALEEGASSVDYKGEAATEVRDLRHVVFWGGRGACLQKEGRVAKDYGRSGARSEAQGS